MNFNESIVEEAAAEWFGEPGYVMNEKVTNQSLRERFKLSEDKTATVSQIIAATMDAGKIKLADPSQTSTRYRSYVPFWA